MKTRKIDIIKICVIIIAICLLVSTSMTIYYNLKYSIKNHSERKSLCDSKGLVYLKTIQSSNEVVKCCEIDQGEIVGCIEFLR